LRNYTVDVAFGEPIAGQNTYRLTITPKVPSRPRKKVWLDAQHYIILRMEDYDITGKLGLLYVYTTIDYDSASVARQLEQYQKERQDRRRSYQSEETSFVEAEKQFGAKIPQPSYLPVGFQLQSTSLLPPRVNLSIRGKSIHLRYTDGLIVLSLFVSRVSDESEDKQHQRARGDRFRDRRSRGDRFGGGKATTVTVKDTPISVTDHGHIKMLRWETSKQSEEKKLRFALVGELSQEELVKVAESLVSQE